MNFLNYGEGKAKLTVSVFFSCLVAFLLGLFIIFGMGGAVGVAIGVAIAIIGLLLTVIFGGLSVILYMSWIEER